MEPQAFCVVERNIERLFACRGDKIKVRHSVVQSTNLLSTPKFVPYCSGDHLHVYMCFDPVTIGVGPIRKVYKDLPCDDSSCGIIYVSYKVPTSGALGYLATNPGMEFWKFSDFAFCILDHCLQPRFEVYRKPERSTTGLPQVLKNDPVARWYGLQTGDILRCIRGLPDGKKMVTDRVVKQDSSRQSEV